MDSSLQVFRYKAQEVRTVTMNGEPYFVAKDIADILEIRDAFNATMHLDDDEKGTAKVSTPGGIQDMTVINEAGLYTLLMRSNKDEAKPFRRWVTHEVLPQIRKTGSYSARASNPVIFDPMAGARIVFEAAGIKDNQLALALDRVYMTYTGASALEAGQITLTAPTKKQLLTPTEIGNIFGIKAHRVNEILAGMGYQHKIAGRWEVLPLGEPYAVMQDTGKSHKQGTPVRQLKWDAGILDALETRINSHC